MNKNITLENFILKFIELTENCKENKDINNLIKSIMSFCIKDLAANYCYIDIYAIKEIYIQTANDKISIPNEIKKITPKIKKDINQDGYFIIQNKEKNSKNITMLRTIMHNNNIFGHFAISFDNYKNNKDIFIYFLKITTNNLLTYINSHSVFDIERFKHFFYSIPEYASIIEKKDDHFFLSDINKSIENDLPIEFPNIVGQNLLDIAKRINCIEIYNIIDEVFKTKKNKPINLITIYLNGIISYLRGYTILINKDKIMVVLNNLTEEIKENKRIRLNNDRTYIAIENSLIGIWEIDVNTKTIIWDDNYLDLYGSERNKPIPFKDWFAFIYKDDQENILNTIKNSHYSSKPIKLTFRIILPDRSIRYIQIYGSRYIDPVTKIIKLIGTNRDVTESYSLKKEIEWNERKLSLAISSAKIGVYNFNIDEKTFNIDNGVRNILKIKKGSVFSLKQWINSIHKDDKDYILKILNKILDTKTPYSEEYKIITPDGTLKHIKVNGIINNNKMIGIVQDITDKKAIEENIKNNKKKYENIFNNMKNAGIVIEYNEELKKFFIREINKATKSILEVNKNIIDSDLYETFEWIKNTPIYNYLETKRKSHKNYNLTKNISIKINKTIKYFNCKIAYINHNIFIIMIDDITKFINKSLELQEKTTELNSLFTSMKNAFVFGRILYDENNNPYNYEILYFNEIFMKLVNITPKNAHIKNPDKILPQNMRNKQLFNTFLRVGDTGKNENNTTYFKEYNLWLNFNVYSPKKGYIATIIEDITEAKEKELAIIEKNNFIEKIFDTSKDILYVYDLNTKYNIYFNKGFYAILGYKSKEIIDMGQDFLKKLMHPDDFKKFEDEIFYKYHNLNDNDTLYTKFRMYDKNNKLHYLSGKELVFKRDNQGTVLQIFGYVKDISEEINRQLEKEKLEKQFRINQRLETITTLVGGIAHDFNNLLTPILGFAELIRFDHDDDQETACYLDEIIKSSYLAKNLVKKLLTFSRQIDDNVKDAIEVSKIVKNTIKLIKSTIPKNIKLSFDINNNKKYIILCSRIQIEQILINIINNAIYSINDKKGEIKVNLSKSYLDEKDILFFRNLKVGEHIKLSISDNGEGIPEEVIERIFEPFYTTKKMGEGSGMGLSVVHGILDIHNADVYVESKLGEGTVFNFYFPEYYKEKTLEKLMLSQKENDSSNIISLIDDDKKITDVMSKIIIKNGFKVETFNDSEKAFQKIIKNKIYYKLIITDLSMPNMSGMALAKALNKFNIKIPIILLSGYPNILTKEEMKENNIIKILIKPVASKQLIEIIEKYIK